MVFVNRIKFFRCFKSGLILILLLLLQGFGISGGLNQAAAYELQRPLSLNQTSLAEAKPELVSEQELIALPVDDLSPRASIAGPQNLSNLITLALERNLGLRRDQLDLKNFQLREEITQNKSIPNLDFEMMTARRSNLDSATRAASGDHLYNNLYTIKLSQMFTALGEGNRLEKAIAALTTLTREIRLNQARISLMQQITRIFFDLLRQQETVKIHRYNLGLVDKLYEVAELNQQVGLATEYDLLRIAVQRSNIEVEILKAENNFANLLTDLLNILNLDQQQQLELKLPQSLKFSLSELDYSEAVQQLLKNDYDLKLVRTDLAIHDRSVDAARKARRPNLILSADYNYGAKVPGGGGNHLNDTSNYNLALVLTAPLYDSGDLKHYASQAQNSLEMARLNLRQLENQKRAALKKDFSNYQEVLQRIVAIEKSIGQSEENMRMVTERFKYGDATVVEIIDAQITLTNVSLAALNAHYDERINLLGIYSKLTDEPAIRILDNGGNRK